MDNGQVVSGHISGYPSANTDTYYFTASENNYITISGSEVGSNTGFWPWLKLYKPDGTLAGSGYADLYYTIQYHIQNGSGEGGTWKVEITRGDYTTQGGDYDLALTVLPGNFNVSMEGASNGGSMYPKTDYDGSIDRGQFNVFTFNVIATGYVYVTVTPTGTSWYPWQQVFNPSGVQVTAGYNNTSYTWNFNVNSGDLGTYSLLMRKYDYWNDIDGTYRVSVSGAGVGMPTGACADGSICLDGCKGGVHAGDPINLATGNLLEQVTDYTTVGANPLSFSRTYNSMSYTRGLTPTMMGTNWRCNYDRYIRGVSSSMVAAERPDGSVVNFTYSGGSWSPDQADQDYELYSSGTTWTLTDHNDSVETYTSSGGVAYLDSIELRNGYTQTLSYDSAGDLSSVSDSYGRSLGFTFTSAGVVSQVTTPDNLTLSYDYIDFTSGRLLQTVGYNTSPATELTYLYENSGRPYALTGITDENGVQFSSWGYDGAGRAVLAFQGVNADYTEVEFISNGDTKVTGPLGIEDTYSFTTSQDKPKASQISRAANGSVAAATQSMTYDTNGYLATLTDWNGNQTAWTNNSYGNPTQIKFASGESVAQTTNITYDTTWPRLPASIATNGVTASLSYDSSGNVSSRTLTDTTSASTPYSTNGWTRTWSYTYTSTGQLASLTLPRNDVSAITYYSYSGGTLTGTADALGHTTNVLTYQSGGLPLTVEDPNGVVTTLSYNNRNWLTSSLVTTSAGTYETGYSYDSAGNLTKVTWPDDSYLSYTYDNAHRLTGIENALGDSQELTLNSAGNVTQTLWKDSGGTTKRQHTATFDALGRMLTSVGGENQTTSYTYDKNGNVLTITDPRGDVTTQTFDALNRLSTVENPYSDTSTITYDSHNRVTSVTDFKGNTTSYTYDGFGDAIQIVSPDTGTDVLYFDSNSNVTKRTDATGAVTNMTYDALDRIKTRTYPADSSLNVAFTYDQSGHGSGVLHLTSATDAAGNLSQDWSQRGLLSSATRTISGTDYTTSYTYESAGRLASITYASSGWNISYLRDNAGQISYVSATQPSHSAVNLATGVTYLPFGPVTGFTCGNGVTSTRTYDDDYRVTAIRDTGASDIYYVSFGYDANNNITSITDNVGSNSQSLQYDSADRLSYASGGSYGTVSSITYDSNGNRLTYGGTTYTVASGSNRMTNDGTNAVSYTSAGNISSIGSDSMSYSKANRLASATVGGTSSIYTYDTFGQRLKAVVGGGTPIIQQYGQNGNLLVETGTNETNYAYLNGTPIAAIDPSTAAISALHTDNLGTPQKATNSSKSTVWSGAYQPFGTVSPTASITMNLRFPGQYADSTGFYYNINRDYIPAYGRYLESDPIGLNSGLNTYSYVRNNPYKWADRNGEGPEELGLIIVGINLTQHVMTAMRPPQPEIIASPPQQIINPPYNVCTKPYPYGISRINSYDKNDSSLQELRVIKPARQELETPPELDVLPEINLSK